jgi:hypothetical protein
MKKILIPAFFVGMILLSYVVAKATASVRMNDNDVMAINQNRSAGDQLIVADRVDIFLCQEVRETRTKGLFGWDLKVDTLKSYYLTEDNRLK